MSSAPHPASSRVAGRGDARRWVAGASFAVAVVIVLGTVVASVARAQECECADDVPDLADRIQRSLIVLEGTVTDVR
ncbi:MAG: hypothetical protein IT379_04670, partial [Deltaproteobacteria bacterium]|nr:hypothetical protein [Deltaproteobacteria bacterium]